MPQHPRAHRRSIPPILALSPALRHFLDEIPQSTFGNDFVRFRIATGRPFWGEFGARGDLWVAGFGDEDDTFVFEAGPGVFERFFVDSFEVGEVALVVECFAELGRVSIDE
jgi:hypothetical protein